MKNTIYLFAIIALVYSCKPTAKEQTGTEVDHSEHNDMNVDVQKAETNGITLTSGAITLREAISLPIIDAKLKVNQPTDGEIYKKLVKFDFDVENYELGSQTQDKNAEHCANSAQGQHIHLILNNSPYTAHYESDFDRELEDGRYIGLAFLSRSYHESIKTKDAYQLFKFSVGKGQDLLNFDTSAPHMFYSRPKGTYTGKDTEKVLLDFYLTNVDLSEAGYKVQAKINGETFLLNKWVPFIMEGLPMGENKIELTLLNAEGNKVESPFNPVTRTITLEADAI